MVVTPPPHAGVVVEKIWYQCSELVGLLLKLLVCLAGGHGHGC